MSIVRRRRPKQESVELNLAAMLDMAFQLLTFFILTFKPAPIEGQIDLRLPPPAQSLVANVPPEIKPIAPVGPLQDLNQLPIRVVANASGQIGELVLGEGPVADVKQLDRGLKQALAGNATFDRIVIEASPGLQYQPLMQVMDICARQKLASGKQLASISLVELPTTENR